MAPRPKIVIVNDKMQRGYRYNLVAPMGRKFDREFCPDLTPKEMLALGIFGGKYMTDCRAEFPANWFARAKLAPAGRDCSPNYFGVDASQPLSVWRAKGSEDLSGIYETAKHAIVEPSLSREQMSLCFGGYSKRKLENLD
jgi:hypothetical protein